MSSGDASAISLISAPAANTSGPPVTTIARIAEFASCCSSASTSWRISGCASALSCLGRLSVTMPTGPSTLEMTYSSACVPSAETDCVSVVTLSCTFLERDVVIENGAGIHRYLRRRLEIQLHKRQLRIPDRSEELFGELNG